jgi:hypothetical protein
MRQRTTISGPRLIVVQGGFFCHISEMETASTRSCHRARIVTSTTVKLEFSAFSMSRTEDGYVSRMKTALDATGMLSSRAAWEDVGGDDEEELETAREITGLLREGLR